MITIGYNQVQEKHVADSNSTAREDAHEAKKVYVGNKLAHVHVNDNTEFALRQTLNGYIHEDNDLYAKIRSIYGNTKVWNQLYDNAVPTAITNHKYYISENNSGTTAKSIATTIAYTADSTDRMCIDLTLIYGAGNEPTTVAEFEADFQQWFGRPIGAEPYDAGSLIPFQATGIKSTWTKDGVQKEFTIPIPVTTLTGKQSGSSTSEIIFPDGMKLAGSVKDEVYVEDGKTYAEKKVGSRAYVSGDENDTTVVTDGHSTTYYELATPIVYEVDNYTLPLYYPANGTGTEEIVSTATSAPADMDIEYRLRQRVRLVDMGTPGVLWADSDIDITKPDGFCDSPFTYDKSFFSWGNVVGHNPISNIAFDYDWGGVNQAEPWYEGQVYGSTPGSTLTSNIPADAQYDAAKAILGGNWRMPSNSEYVNLFSICKFLEANGSDMDTSKTDKRVDMPDGNGGTVKGIYIESTVTGNRLFFSCSGYGNGRSWYGRRSNGYYWSSTFVSARNARSLSFRSGGVYPQYSYDRCSGFALRPVFPISQ